jgi:uncharacterized membrane protein
MSLLFALVLVCAFHNWNFKFLCLTITMVPTRLKSSKKIKTTFTFVHPFITKYLKNSVYHTIDLNKYFQVNFD